MAQVNRPTKLITIAYISRGSCAATDSLCIFAFFGYDTSPPGCDYRAPTGPGRAHMLTGRAQNCGRENGPGWAGPKSYRAGPGRAVEFRPVQTSSHRVSLTTKLHLQLSHSLIFTCFWRSCFSVRAYWSSGKCKVTVPRRI